MENTNQKTYLVSFGNSRQYLYRQNADGTSSVNIADIEKKLSDYLTAKFPQTASRYYTTAKLTEINPSDLKEYAGYPELDARAITEIEKVLVKGIDDENSLRSLDSDAPWSNV